MYVLREHVWRRNSGSVTPIAVSDDPSLLEERAQELLTAQYIDHMLVWTEEVPTIRYSNSEHFDRAEHYWSIMPIPNLTR